MSITLKDQKSIIIEKSPPKKKIRSIKTFNTLNMSDANVGNLIAQKNLSKQVSLTNPKGVLDMKNTSDSSLNFEPKRILKFKSISPGKTLQRLKTQGTVKKVKKVEFKDQISIVKEVTSISRFLKRGSAFKNNESEVNVKAVCSCTCAIF
jgi:hypothetical protein